MPPAEVQLLRAPTSTFPVAKRVIGCRFVGVVMIPHPDKQSERAELEVYLNPSNGKLFGVDAAYMAETPPRIVNFMNPEAGGVLDVSDEPADRLLDVKTVKFMRA